MKVIIIIWYILFALTLIISTLFVIDMIRHIIKITIDAIRNRANKNKPDETIIVE